MSSSQLTLVRPSSLSFPTFQAIGSIVQQYMDKKRRT